MNGFDFNHRVLKPWVRDPAYYQSIWMYKSDVLAHEGPTHHAVLEFWTYELPVATSEERRMIAELEVIPPATRQARKNLYAHANEMTMEQAGGAHMKWTPRSWMKTERELLIFEQHLYLRQPGYGTSYITGKYLLERTLSEHAKLKEERGEEFVLREFFDQLNGIDSIPIAGPLANDWPG